MRKCDDVTALCELSNIKSFVDLAVAASSNTKITSPWQDAGRRTRDARRHQPFVDGAPFRRLQDAEPARRSVDSDAPAVVATARREVTR